MLPSLPVLSDYDISPQNGFLPNEIPIDVLPDRYYEPWETVARNFQSLILSKRLRQIVDALPILSTDLLLTEAEWRRAYSLLGFIAHAYVWGGNTPSDVSLTKYRHDPKLMCRNRSSHLPFPYGSRPSPPTDCAMSVLNARPDLFSAVHDLGPSSAILGDNAQHRFFRPLAVMPPG